MFRRTTGEDETVLPRGTIPTITGSRLWWNLSKSASRGRLGPMGCKLMPPASLNMFPRCSTLDQPLQRVYYYRGNVPIAVRLLGCLSEVRRVHHVHHRAESIVLSAVLPGGEFRVESERTA